MTDKKEFENKPKQRDKVEGPTIDADGKVVAEDGGEITSEMEEIYELDKQKKEEAKENREEIENELIKSDNDNSPVQADTLEVPRYCSNCYLQDKCQFFEDGEECHFKTAVNIENPNDLFELIKQMIEIQGERVLFGRFIEEMEGGYVDRNLSSEVERMLDMVKQLRDIMQEKEEISIQMRGKEAVKSGGGILSEIFGGDGNSDNDSEEQEEE